jgi:nitrogen fixation NifU-like protein
MKYTDFTDIVMAHFRNPRNVGELANADATAKVVNGQCGDIMLLTLRVVDDVIQEAAFKVFGCTGSIGVGSIAVELLQGMPLAEAETLTEERIREAAGGLGEGKQHCAELAADTIAAAIENYRAT